MRRIAITLCALLALIAPASYGQQADDRPGAPPILVLKNGRVIRGHIQPRAGGYDVVLDAGRLFIDSETVRFEATDLGDAYRKLRGSFRELTPSLHIELAKWCIANNQINSARQELLDALHLEPHRQEAREMLKRLERVANPSPPPQPRRSLSEIRTDQFMRQDHESLGGLDSEQAETFVARVQPILQRGCGNASCHGTDKASDFVLARTRGRSHRIVAERNLAAVLRRIDFKNPAASPLLQAIDKPHAGDGRSILHGRGGRVQREVVVKWVNSVTAESREKPARKTAARGSNAHGSNAGSGGIVQVSARSEDPPRTASLSAAERQARQRVLDKVRTQNLPDPFDPDAFNRLHHGVNARGQRTPSAPGSPSVGRPGTPQRDERSNP